MVLLKYNWDEIALEYIKGLDKDGKIHFPTKIELAKIHGCDPEYLRSFARRGQWDDKRQAYLLKIELNDCELSIDDPVKELQKFNVKCYQMASNSLDILIRQMRDTKNHNFQNISIMIKLLGQIQSIGKNSFTEMPDEFEKAKSEFERLMKRLKEDEKEVKVPPASLPSIETIDLTNSSP